MQLMTRRQTSPLAEAKPILRIPELWERLGYIGQPSKICRSPFREDSNPSFSVSPDGLLWNDFADGDGGDAVDFLARALDLDKTESAREFLKMAGDVSKRRRLLPAIQQREPAPIPARPLPVLLPWELSDSFQLKRLRSWPIATGPENARVRDLLGACMLRDGEGPPVRCWALSDSAGKVLQARRLDGEPFRHRWTGETWEPCSPFKAKTFGAASWPVGAANLRPGRAVVIVEGGPDMLAGLALGGFANVSNHVDFVAILGAAQTIHPKALPMLAGRRMRILTHADEPGRNAARRWAAQLREAGAGSVDALTISGPGIADLSDMLARWDVTGCNSAAVELFAGLIGGGK